MRYVCYQNTVSRIVDENILLDDEISSILHNIKKEELTCLIHLKDGEQFLKVRIKDIKKNEFSYYVYTIESKLNKSSLFTDIVYLEIIVEDRILSYLKTNASRWSLLDPTEF